MAKVGSKNKQKPAMKTVGMSGSAREWTVNLGNRIKNINFASVKT